jgi:hypothetical protein
METLVHPAGDPAAERAEELARQKRHRRKLVSSVLVVSVALHLLAALGAGIWIVARYFAPPPATFVMKKPVSIPPRIVEQKMAAAEYEAMAPKPSFDDKMSSLRATDFALPDLPKLPVENMISIDPSSLVAEQLGAVTGAAGGGGGDGGTGGSGDLSSISFLGIQAETRSVLIMYDISTTVVNSARRGGIPFEKIREETMAMIDGLSINTRFNMVQFARNYAYFSPEMLPATDGNRARAKEWLNRWFATEGSMKQGTPAMVTGGPGFAVLLKTAFELQPDSIFIISDGAFYRSQGGPGGERIPYDELEDVVKQGQNARAEPVQIYFIGVGMKPADEAGMKKVLRAGRGRGVLKELGK